MNLLRFFALSCLILRSVFPRPRPAECLDHHRRRPPSGAGVLRVARADAEPRRPRRAGHRLQQGLLPAGGVQSLAFEHAHRSPARDARPLRQRHPFPRVEAGRHDPAALVQGSRLHDAMRRQALPQLAHEGEGRPALVVRARIPPLREPRRRHPAGRRPPAGEPRQTQRGAAKVRFGRNVRML